MTTCERCPRLREYCRVVAEAKRRAYRDWEYWGKPVPSFGDPNARVLMIGLAPGAHGANRTGRMFTGDRSGEFLYRALYQTGFASQPESRFARRWLALSGVYITAAVALRTTGQQAQRPEEFRNCRPYLERELDHPEETCAWWWRWAAWLSTPISDPARPRRHRERVGVPCLPMTRAHDRTGSVPLLISSYHPSQQNTSTGKLTAEMLRQVFERARKLCGD